MEALVEKCYDQLESTFRTDDDLENFKRERSASVVRAADYIHKLLFKYFNRLNTNFEITEQEDEFFWDVFRKRSLIFEETYKDFYLSLDAIENVKRFWKCCEELGKSLQKESRKI